MQTSQLFYNFIAMVLMCSNAFCQVENSTRATQQEITINFDLLDLRGTLHPLSQNDKGMVRAFVFLSTTCPISNSYIQELNRQYEALPSRIQLFGVISNSAISRVDAIKHFRDFDAKFPILFDGSELLAEVLQPTHVPEAFLVDSSGKVIYRGAIDNAYESIGRRRANVEQHFLQDALADWAAKRSCVTNWNYNSFSVYLLATAYRVTHESKYLQAAKEKARLGVLPGGPYKGRWADQHNARPAYHYIIVRGLTALFAVLPDDATNRESIAMSIRAAMQARNKEFTSKGIMNVDSSMEALLLFKSLSADQRKAIGFCQTDEAFAVLERHCVSRLRKDGGPFSPGVGGGFFKYIAEQP